MAETVIRIQAVRDAVRRALLHLPAQAMSGGSAGNAVVTRAGLAALGRIKKAFITKSRGGTDEAGDKWAPLAPSTVAQRKRGKRSGSPTEILVDTGALLNSLSSDAAALYQVFRVKPGEVVIGTNRPGAIFHHTGNPSRNLPQRRLWPKPSNWPPSWWADILQEARSGVVELAVQLARTAR